MGEAANDIKQANYTTTLKSVSVAVNLGVSILNEMVGKELSKLRDEDEAELLIAFMANELRV